MSQPNPPRYGHRHEIVHNTQGSPFNQDTPLEPDDFLDPLPGDVFYHGELHDREVSRLRAALQRLLRGNPALSVLSRVKLILPPPAASHPLPDLVIIKNIGAPTRPRTVFDIEQTGVVPACVIEITSPLFSAYDLGQKVQLYAAAGIPEYIVLDTGLRPDRTQPSPTIFAFNSQGTAVCESAQTYAGRVLGTRLEATSDGFVIIDPATNAPIDPHAEDSDTLSSTQAEGKFRAQSIASRLKL